MHQLPRPPRKIPPVHRRLNRNGRGACPILRFLRYQPETYIHDGGRSIPPARGKGYSTAATRSAAFLSDPPAAVAPADYNGRRPATKPVAYGNGMSEWCANCHATLLTGSDGARIHPQGKRTAFPGGHRQLQRLRRLGELDGSRATAYSSMVPYEMGTADYDLLQRTANSNGGTTTGPDSDANVACLSCHRAMPRVGPRGAMEHEDRVPGIQRRVSRSRGYSRSSLGLPGADARGNAKDLLREAGQPLTPPTSGPLQQVPRQGLIDPLPEAYSSPNFFTWYRRES